MAESKKRIVVVGASFAGVVALVKAQSYGEITVIEPKDYWEYVPSVVQYLATEDTFNEFLLPISAVTKNANVVRGYFAGIDEDRKIAYVKIVRDGSITNSITEVAYDVLILSNGVPYSAPVRSNESSLTMSARIKELSDFANNLKTAQSVIIAGGGETGVELMGEVASRLKIPKMTLLSRQTILPHLPPAAGQYAMKWFKDHNVDIQLGGSIKYCDEKSITLSNGQILTADVVIDCTNRGWDRTPPTGPATKATVGSKVLYDSGNGWVLGVVRSVSPDELSVEARGQVVKVPNDKNVVYVLSHAAEQLPGVNSAVWPYDSKGYVAVDVNMKSIAFDGIFAAGDVTNIINPLTNESERSVDLRTAQLAEAQAKVAVRNVASYLSGSFVKSKLSVYPRDQFGNVEILLSNVSLGPHAAVFALDNNVFGGPLVEAGNGFFKQLVKRSKVAEAQQKLWGILFWIPMNFMVKWVHILFGPSKKIQISRH